MGPQMMLRGRHRLDGGDLDLSVQVGWIMLSVASMRCQALS